MKGWLAFAVQKITELTTLARALNDGRDGVRDALAAASAAIASRRTSPKIHDPAVKRPRGRPRSGHAPGGSRLSEKRRGDQRAKLNLPAYPTTTIGSFPQTQEIGKARADYSQGEHRQPGL